MSRRFLVPVRLLSLASAPSSASVGDTYFDTSAGSLKTYNGSQWVGAGGVTLTQVNTAVSSAISTHNSATTSVHGIADTSALVVTTDSRLSDSRTPTDGSVTTAKLVDGAVTSAKIADGTIVDADINASAAIAPSKISGTAVITTDSRLSDTRTPTDGSVTTAKIVDGAVTSAKIADGTIVDGDISTSAAIAQSKISGLSTSLAAKADLASPTFTGTPAAPTATAGTNTTQLATTAFVRSEIAALVGAAPGTLDTLAEIDAQLAADESAVAALTTVVGTKAPLASPTFTGTPAAPTATAGTNTTQIATTAFVAAAVAATPVPVAQTSEPSSPVDGQIWVDTDGTAGDFVDTVQANFLAALMGAI